MYFIEQSLRTKYILFYDKGPLTSWSNTNIIFAETRFENVSRVLFFWHLKLYMIKKKKEEKKVKLK